MAKKKGAALLAWAAMLVVLSACTGSTGAATLSTGTRQVTAAAMPTPATSSNGGEDLLARGKVIYEKTAGGLGCASCHGLDGKGASAPYNRGASESKVREVLAGATMSFIKLSDEEIKAVVAYLQWLGTQP